ncbi:tRNA (adenine(22)-N(1))-methyltransferase [Desulfofundulus thermocisternus]|uniref:tRNA (adenine(22)-N(1))-methyltransferase n=1 Tax=Desulfofundulus thermocisternus TaxID=42471 RepID=UPI001A0925C9|nr:class I SAM-dependent methyltransferase [Desulfofundulus thermocisternus]MBE3585571.1 SAM-dependent methyltransferase [Thermoanaerobacter sp.]MCS5696158.1 class I SAM-dependent methyltransferase [Desulfofundulus thermocisternus]
MRLTRRLAAIAAYVPPGAVVADIGTDHALLPIYLVAKGICPKAVATELNAGPYRSARTAVHQHGLDSKIDVRRGDGLQPLSPGEAQVIVLAGLGGNTIREILAASPEVLAASRRLILQPMADEGNLRLWLVKNGWRLVDETLVEDDGRLYMVMVAEPGPEKVSDSFILEIGPRLVEKKHPLLPVYIHKLISEYQHILESLARSNSPRTENKFREITTRLARLQEVLKKCQ